MSLPNWFAITRDGFANWAPILKAPYPTAANMVLITSLYSVADDRLTCTPALEVGDVIEWGNVNGGALADSAVTVNSNGTWEADAAVTSFQFRVWDHNDETWGNWG